MNVGSCNKNKKTRDTRKKSYINRNKYLQERRRY